MSSLEEYYPGDGRWNAFVSFYTTRVPQNTLYQQLVVELQGNKDLAIVVLGIFEDERCFRWIASRPTVLDGVSPIECLRTDALKKRLRTALMRFPV